MYGVVNTTSATGNNRRETNDCNGRDPRGAHAHCVLQEVDRTGLNHVSEVFDGDAPQRGGGTFAQAWNTGELLRARALLASWPQERRP